MDEGKAILFSFGLMLKLGITSFDEIIKNGNKLIGKSGCLDKGCERCDVYKSNINNKKERK